MGRFYCLRLSRIYAYIYFTEDFQLMTESINLYLLLRVFNAVWMGFVELLLETRGLCFYSKVVLGPHKWSMLMGKADKFSELQTPAFDGGVANAQVSLPDLQPSLQFCVNNFNSKKCGLCKENFCLL